QYDLASRLTHAGLAYLMPAPRTFDYSYDGFGNMLSKRLDPGLGPDPVRDALRQLYDFTGRSYTDNRIADVGYVYDANGNLKNQPSVIHTWDAQNRLVTAWGLGSYQEQYQYDAAGYRLSVKSQYDRRRIFYVRDAGGRVLAEYGKPDESGLRPRWSKDYVYANGRTVALIENEAPGALSGAYSSTGQGPTVTFQWDPVADTDLFAYRLYRSALREGLRLIEGTSTTPSIQSSSLPGWFWLTAIDEAGNESAETVAFYVQPGDVVGPTDVSPLTGSQQGTNPEVRLDWGAVLEDDVQGYDVYRKLPTDPAFGASPLNGAPVRDITYTDAGLTAGGEYQYKVKARDTAGNESTGVLVTVHVSLGGGGGCLPSNPMCGVSDLRDESSPPDEEGWEIAWAFEPDGWAEVRDGADGGYWERISERPEELDLAEVDLIMVGQASQAAWRVVYLHTDHLGSVRMTSAGTGAVESYHTYEPFGWEVPQSYTSTNTHRFTGHERDQKTGLDYMLARYYGSNHARFLSVDPAADSADPAIPQSWNRYFYSANNPIAFIDPDGRKYINTVGQDLRDEVINQTDPSPTGTATVKDLDAEPEKVKVKVSKKAALGLVDSSGNLVPGTKVVVKPSNAGKAANDLQSKAKPGQTVAPIGGEYEVKKVDANTGNVTKSKITIYSGSQAISVQGQNQTTQEFVRTEFVHESAHGVGPGVAPEPKAQRIKRLYILESRDGKP
ncbi:MAG: RHS repeat-associated core domain-containing protein, partial [Gemmatimonadales bacterium]